MELKTKQVTMVEVQDWNAFIEEVYKRPYNFQQQDGCKSRGIHILNVPPNDLYDFENKTISEYSRDDEMGVSFKSWLERDPEQKLSENDYDWSVRLFWEQNFYPSVEVLADDLYKRGLLDKGEYIINIDW